MIEAHVRDEATLSKVAAALATVGRDPRTDPATHRVSITVDGGTHRLVEAARALDHIGVPVEDLSLRRPSLDEVFLVLTDHKGQS